MRFHYRQVLVADILFLTGKKLSRFESKQKGVQNINFNSYQCMTWSSLQICLKSELRFERPKTSVLERSKPR